MAEKKMIGLLASVRDENEVKIALNQTQTNNCLRLIDVKEPRNGALGQVNAARLRNIGTIFNKHEGGQDRTQVGLSVALGEAVDLQSESQVFTDTTILQGFDFAKIGLAGLGDKKNWWDRWEKLLKKIPAEIKTVAVAYADYYFCNSPDPIGIASVGKRLGCDYVLLDTYTKDGRCLFDFMSPAMVEQFVKSCRNAGQTVVIAGALKSDNLHTAVMCQPCFIGVRGAICESDRTASISEIRLANFIELLVNIQSKIAS